MHSPASRPTHKLLKTFGSTQTDLAGPARTAVLLRVYPRMLSFTRRGSSGPLLILLHWLGGGAQTWQEVTHGLAARGVQCAALDLPGFGGSANVAGYDKRSMADQVIEAIRHIRALTRGSEAASPWVLAGHSMGGSVAAIVARRALDGEPGLEGLRGLVLVSPSPPAPEPIPAGKRAEMLDALGTAGDDPKQNRKAAASFVDENTGKLALPDAIRDRAIEGVLTMNRAAFRMWLEHGSKEDWRKEVGTLALPALVLAGTEESALGPQAQRELTLPHLPEAKLIELQAAGHLGPLERSGEIVEYVTEFLTGMDLVLATPVAEPGPTLDGLMHSNNTSPKTLTVMTARLGKAQDWNNQPKIFSPAELRTLRALAQAVVPDAGFDLASCIDHQLRGDKGDGWRFADLPTDCNAWHRGLQSLDHAAQSAHGVSFLALHPGQQHELLQQASDGKLGKGLLGTLHVGRGADAYSGPEMKQWIEDVRGEFTRLYMGDPRTMDRIGYTGFADEFGFTQIQLGQSAKPEHTA